MVQTRKVNLLELAKGAIMEQVDNESAKILSNILDPNTDATKARKLTITVTFKSDDKREFISCEAQAKSTIAPVMPITTKLLVEQDMEGNPRAMEITRDDPNQVHMFEETEPEVNVLQLRSVK
ncbi:MAG: hypothetical protein Q8911_00310 [Bacillota bacterium]|nr:hypothetical protein [Bacillota bacterium]